MKRLPFLWSGLLLASPSVVRAGCCEHHEPADAFRRATVIGEYRIVAAETVAKVHGGIATRYRASLTEALKGKAPDPLEFETPGGRRGGVVEFSSLSENLAVGDDCILHLLQAPDGSWSLLPFQTAKNRGTPAARKALRDYFRGGARGRRPQEAPDPGSTPIEGFSGVPGSVVSPTGYLENASGHPPRHTAGDGGIAIPYLVDVDPTKLPPGMDTAGALAAVAEALDAWSAASSLTFRFAGTQSFGAGANTIVATDGHLRIQLHDSHGQISGTTLGVGGGRTTDVFPTTGSPVFFGGVVAGQGFQKMQCGYVVLEHNHASMDDIDTFKVVLTHEIGHSLGLGHSSNNPSEPDPILSGATMYYRAPNDGRGAAIAVYDEDRIRFGYPVANTPPYTTDRIIRAVCRSSTSATLPAVPGVNRITIQAFDRQGDTLATPVLSYSSSVKFSVSGNQLVFAATDYLTGPALDDNQIESGVQYGLAYVQIGDGVNLSAASRCTVIETQSDSTPADGLPNAWMTTYFSTTAVGAAGAAHHPDSDPDGDGLTNREEYFFRTHPKVPDSGPVRPVYDHAAGELTFDPVRFVPYRIESADSPAGPWTLRGIGTRFGATGTLGFDVSSDSPPARQFFRVVTTP